ncbi:Spy/CpxP family protein refolding chaperone [Pseudomonas sp. MWU13-2100]|uniref:Spy/CpxP family protein refolding chaperone n=1 Tax=Pseudomonas sp. MWU13-2100 TaxID=2935075 RepID=UPI00298BD853|nr:Spy/CpxP family protein refolding chaperone [Pseudomonas sp. MWU13-2100]
MFKLHSEFDWIKHTQLTLDDLKGKLNLKPEQLPAWETWSSGVLADAKEQLHKGNGQSDKGSAPPKALVDQTTPERMARGIERLRAQNQWMQAHLVRLDAAQVRTQTFYDSLAAEQKTIFDLFWTAMHHRACAADGWQMPMQSLNPSQAENRDETVEQ